MKDNLYETRIHGFAAEQVLFCIDTNSAHRLLSKYLGDARYNMSLGINYTFHWEMAEPDRSGLIERYHLKNLSGDLKVRLDSQSSKVAGNQRIVLAITLENVGDKPFRIGDREAAYSDYIYLRHLDGPFVQRMETATRCFGMTKWIELRPGDSHEYTVDLVVKPISDKMVKPHNMCEDAEIYLHDDPYTAYYIDKPGKFQAYAMFQTQPLHPERQKRLDFDNAWVGRAVSKPVTFEIKDR
jgi:hypothetical protein